MFQSARLRKGKSDDYPRHWLVVRLSALGDVALTTGVLLYLHEKYGWTFDVLTLQQWEGVFSGHPAVRKIHGVTKEALKNRGLKKLSVALQAEYTGCGLLDLHGTLRSRRLALRWKGVVLRYSKFSFERRCYLKSGRRLYSKLLLRYNVPQRYVMAVESVPPERERLLPKIFLNADELDKAKQLLESFPPIGKGQGENVAGNKIVALHPYSTHLNKAWTTEAWQKLASLLLEAGYRVVILGVGSSPFVQMVEETSKGFKDFSNMTTLRETCSVLAGCDMLVTGDSGPMHLACAVRTPVVALFGPTHRVWGFYPEGEKDVVFEADCDCRPCSLHGTARCSHDQRCMTSILPEEVLKAIVKGT